MIYRIEQLHLLSPQERKTNLASIFESESTLELVNTDLSAIPLQELIDFFSSIPNTVGILNLEATKLNSVKELAQVFQSIPKHITKVSLGNNNLALHPGLAAALKELKNVNALKLQANQFHTKTPAELLTLLRELQPNIKILVLSLIDLKDRTDAELADLASGLLNIDEIGLQDANGTYPAHPSIRTLLKGIRGLDIEFIQAAYLDKWKTLKSQFKNLDLSLLEQYDKKEYEYYIQSRIQSMDEACSSILRNLNINITESDKRLVTFDTLDATQELRIKNYRVEHSFYQRTKNNMLMNHQMLYDGFLKDFTTFKEEIEAKQKNCSLLNKTAPESSITTLNNTAPENSMTPTPRIQPANEMETKPAKEQKVTISDTSKPKLTPVEPKAKNNSSQNNIGLRVLSGFIAVLGITAIALAFTVLNAATLGIVGLAVLGVGITALLGGIGLFAFNARKSTPTEPAVVSKEQLTP